MRIFPLILLLVLNGCVTWEERQYPFDSGPTNLSVDVEAEGKPFWITDMVLDIYEERPACHLGYVGSIHLDEKNLAALPINKNLSLVLAKHAQTLGAMQSSESEVRLRPLQNVRYKITYREREGSSEVLLKARSQGQARYQEIEGRGGRGCDEIIDPNPANF